MSEIVQIIAEKRKISGTGNSRNLRSNDKIPGIIYGEKKDPILITINKKIIKMAISNANFFSKQCEIKVENEIYKVLPKDMQLHPVKENLLHLDFLRVGENTMVTLSVPVKFINENECEGIKQGGVLNVVKYEVEVKTPVNKIPEFLEADLSGLQIGDSIHISSIKIDVDVDPTIKDRDFTIATIAPPTVMQIEEEVKEEVETEETDETEQTEEGKEEVKDEKGKPEESSKEQDDSKGWSLICEMILIVGLGNPGNKYEDTRHNIGFKIIDEVHNYYEFPPFRKKFDGLYSKKKIFEQNIVIFKPTSFMNVCGKPILNMFNFFKIKNSTDLIVFHDDLDMNFSKIRIKSSGSDGGHNGIKNIIKFFGDEFYRIKFGIKNNFFVEKKIKAEIFVLEKFSNSEILLVNQIKRAIAKNLNLVIKKKSSFINNLPKN